MKWICLAGCIIVIGAASTVMVLRARPDRHAAQVFAAGILSAAEKGSDSASKARDACTLLSKEELSTITKMRFFSSESAKNGDDESSCNYEPGPGNIYPVTLTVTFKYGKAAMETIQHAAPSMLQGAKNGGPGLGDSSFFLPMDVSLYALKGDVLVNIGFGLGAETREQKRALVAKVLSRL